MFSLQEEFDLSESQSDDEVIFYTKVQKLSSIELSEFSLDNLLLERERDNSITRSISYSDQPSYSIPTSPAKMSDVFEFVEEKQQDQESILNENIKSNKNNSVTNEQKSPNGKIKLEAVPALSNRDPSIFFPTNEKMSFPSLIFHYLQIDQEQNETSFNQLVHGHPVPPDHLLKMFFLYPNAVPASPQLFFSFALHIVSNNLCDSNNCLMKYSQQLPEHSIDYSIYRTLFVHSISHSPQSIFSLFSVYNYFLFKFASEEESDRIKMEIILLFFGLIMTTDVVSNVQFSSIIHNIRPCLLATDFDQSQIDYIVAIMLDLTGKLPAQALASVISQFPIDGAGAPIIYSYCIKLIFIEFGVPCDKVEISLPCLAEHFTLFQSFFDHDNDNELQKASAVLGLVERAIITGFQLFPMDYNAFTKILQALKVNFKNSSVGSMTLLKEQIHATRSQLEMIYVSYQQDPSSDLFF